MHRLLFAGLAIMAQAATIRDVDFRNFSYPFVISQYISVPNRLRWMPVAASRHVRLRDGDYTFACDEPPCNLITFDGVEFGQIAGIEGEVAIITMVFHTGGTANWEYLYLVGRRAGKPQVVAWLEAGSRADMGLRRFAFHHGDLILIVNDPEKREGDCCSSGTITYRYRWHDGTFHQIGVPVLADDPQ